MLPPESRTAQRPFVSSPRSSWARGTAPAQGKALGVAYVVGERRPGLERQRAVDGDGEDGGGSWSEAETVGDAAAGKCVVAKAGILRRQAQRPFESARAGLVEGYLLGAGGVASRGEGYGDRVRAGAIGVQPHPGPSAGDVRAPKPPTSMTAPGPCCHRRTPSGGCPPGVCASAGTGSR